MLVEIWSDVVCPWCYIGKRRFERALEGFAGRDAVEVVYRSFQLDPAAPSGAGQPTADRLATKYGVPAEEAQEMMARVSRTAAADGLEYHLERTVSGNTLDAHRVLHLARRRGLQDAAVERLFRAYFTEGRSLFDHDSLAALGAEAGLDPHEVRLVLEGDAYAGDVAADAETAVALGVTGVPFFVLDDRYGVSGAQPAALFARALEQAWATRDHPHVVPDPEGAAP